MNQEIKNQIEKMLQDAEEGKNNIDATDIIKLIESQKKKSLEERLQEYLQTKRDAEKKDATIDDIESKIRHFFAWGNINTYEDITKEKYRAYKNYLMQEKKGKEKSTKTSKKGENGSGEKLTTVNKRITFINGFLKYIKLDGYCLKQEKIQNKSNLENVYTKEDITRLIKFCNSTKEIDQAKEMQEKAETKEELKKANLKMRNAKMVQKKKKQAKAIILAFYGLGIRDSEVKAITVEAIKAGKVVITNKGKTREVPIGKEIKKELQDYCRETGIKTGCIFRSQNKNSKRLSHSQIWRILQWATGQMRINKNKAHEHSLRHLTGKELAKVSHNDRKVIADILGHSDSRTSEIYLQKSFAEQKADMNKLGIKELSKKK